MSNGIDSAESQLRTHWPRLIAACVLCLALPLLLCVPAVLMLRHDAQARSAANAILSEQIGALDKQLVDIRDLNKVKAQVLSRKQVAEQVMFLIESTADALVVFSRLPQGVQLVALQADGERITLDVRCAAPAAELAVLDLLAEHGFYNLRVSTRRMDGTIERVSIEALSGRGRRT